MFCRSLCLVAVQWCLLLCTQPLSTRSAAFEARDAAGEWSQWSDWTPCSAQCRTGFTVRSRRCGLSGLLPSMSPGSTESHCPGNEREIRLCNKQECQDGSLGWREEQCSKYDSSLHSGRRYTWEPFTHPSEPCALTCRAKGHHFYTTLTDTVVDGTPCAGATTNPSAICLQGLCKEVGCDDVVGSPWRRDSCGVCRGDNTACRTVSGVFSEQLPSRGMTEIVKFPAGATHINVTGQEYSINWLALQTEAGNFILNGGVMKSQAGDYEAAGTIFSYQTSQRCSGQCITAQGPLDQPVMLMINIRGVNRGVEYSFNVPVDVKDDYFRRIVNPTRDPDEVGRGSEEDFIGNDLKNETFDDGILENMMESVHSHNPTNEEEIQGGRGRRGGEKEEVKGEENGHKDLDPEQTDKVVDTYPQFDEGNDDRRFGDNEGNTKDSKDEPVDGGDDISLHSDDSSIVSTASAMEDMEIVSKTSDKQSGLDSSRYESDEDNRNNNNHNDEDGEDKASDSDILADDSEVGAPEPLLLTKPGDDIIRKSTPQFTDYKNQSHGALTGNAMSSELSSDVDSHSVDEDIEKEEEKGEEGDSDDDDDNGDSDSSSNEESEKVDEATSARSNQLLLSSTTTAKSQNASSEEETSASEHTLAYEQTSAQNATSNQHTPMNQSLLSDTNSSESIPSKEAADSAKPMVPSYPDQHVNDLEVTPGQRLFAFQSPLQGDSPSNVHAPLPPSQQQRQHLQEQRERELREQERQEREQQLREQREREQRERGQPGREHLEREQREREREEREREIQLKERQQQWNSFISNQRRRSEHSPRPSYSQSFIFQRRRHDHDGRADSRPGSEAEGSRQVMIRVPPRRQDYREAESGSTPYQGRYPDRRQPSPFPDRQALTLGHSASRDQDGFLSIRVGEGGDGNGRQDPQVSNPSSSPANPDSRHHQHLRHDWRRHQESSRQMEYSRQQEEYRREMDRRRQQMEQQRAAQEAEYQRRLEEHKRKLRERELEIQRRQQQHHDNNNNHHHSNHHRRHHNLHHHQINNQSLHHQDNQHQPQESQHDRRQEIHMAVPTAGRVMPGDPLSEYSGQPGGSSRRGPDDQYTPQPPRFHTSEPINWRRRITTPRWDPSRIHNAGRPDGHGPTDAPAHGQTRDFLPDPDDRKDKPLIAPTHLSNIGSRVPEPPRFIPEDSRQESRSALHGPDPSYPSSSSSSSSNEIPSGVLMPDVIGPDGDDNLIVPMVNERGHGGEGRLSVTDSQSEKMSYEWRVSGLTQCTVTCGGGVQQTAVVCLDMRTHAVVTNGNCAHLQQPEVKTVTCNTRPCPAEWQSGEWSACSVTCGPGQQTRLVTCSARISPTLNLTRPEENCQGSARPESRRQCQNQPCSGWTVGEWSQCSVQCGEGVRSRNVFCADQTGYDVSDNICTGSKPEAEEACDMGPCGQGWYYTQWPEQCPARCGSGTMTRRVTCVGAGSRGGLPASSCQGESRPEPQQSCRAANPCGGQWFSGEWAECNVTCGQGHQNREALCIKVLPGGLHSVVGEENCEAGLKPETWQPCQLDACAAEWYITSWTKCSKSCGTGQRSREVKCLDPQQRPSSDCPLADKPVSRETCNSHPCSATTPRPEVGSECQDSFSRCELVRHARMCRYPFYQKKCCATCAHDT